MGRDFNTRTGKLEGWWEGWNEREEEEERRSKDRKVNKEDRYLIDRLGDAGLYIFNGYGKKDREGMWTYLGRRGESVLDYRGGGDVGNGENGGRG